MRRSFKHELSRVPTTADSCAAVPPFRALVKRTKLYRLWIMKIEIPKSQAQGYSNWLHVPRGSGDDDLFLTRPNNQRVVSMSVTNFYPAV